MAFDTARVQAALHGTCFHTVTHFPSIGSTNTHAVELAHAGADAGQVFVADEQTAGRGRGGHAWHSAVEDGLYLSALVRPVLRGGDALKISLATGLAVQRAVREVTGVRVDLRWPNDLVIPRTDGASKKLGGILTETAMEPDGRLRFAVIGIGINLNHAEMPEPLRETATSLRIERGTAIERETLILTLLHALSTQIAALEADPRSVLDRFTEHSGWAHGKSVNVDEEGGYTGVTDGLSATGLLRVRTADGVREVRNGGVREAEWS